MYPKQTLRALHRFSHWYIHLGIIGFFPSKRSSSKKTRSTPKSAFQIGDMLKNSQEGMKVHPSEEKNGWFTYKSPPMM